MRNRYTLPMLALVGWAVWFALALRPEPPPAWHWPAPPEPVHATMAKVAVGEVLLADPAIQTCELPAWLPETVERWRADICAAAERHAVDPALLAIVVTVESGGDPWAQSSAGALGLGQVVPRWWPAITQDGEWHDPAHNLDVSAFVLADALSRYGVRDDGPDWLLSVDRAAATYNGGSAYASNPETNRYRAWVSGMWRERHDDASPTLDRWKRAGGARLIAQAAAR